MGNAFKELKLKREEIVITTKASTSFPDAIKSGPSDKQAAQIFFGTKREDPNQKGLSRKHIVEGLKASLKRMQLDYVDIVYAHRPDPSVPIEETVRAFNWCIDQGLAFYWGKLRSFWGQGMDADRNDRIQAPPSGSIGSSSRLT